MLTASFLLEIAEGGWGEKRTEQPKVREYQTNVTRKPYLRASKVPYMVPALELRRLLGQARGSSRFGRLEIRANPIRAGAERVRVVPQSSTRIRIACVLSWVVKNVKAIPPCIMSVEVA